MTVSQDPPTSNEFSFASEFRLRSKMLYNYTYKENEMVCTNFFRRRFAAKNGMVVLVCYLREFLLSAKRRRTQHIPVLHNFWPSIEITEN